MKRYLGYLSTSALILLLIMIFASPLQAGIYLSGVASQEVQAPMLLGLAVTETSSKQDGLIIDQLNFQAYEILALSDSGRNEVELAGQGLITVARNGVLEFEVLQLRLYS